VKSKALEYGDSFHLVEPARVTFSQNPLAMG